MQIDDAVLKACDMFNQQFKLRGIQVVRELDDNLPPIQADANRLEQVFINLRSSRGTPSRRSWRTARARMPPTDSCGAMMIRDGDGGHPRFRDRDS